MKMLRFGIINIVLLSWCFKSGGAEMELSPMIVYDLLSLRIDNVIHETRNHKSELAETKAVVERIEQKIERIDADMQLLASKVEESEKGKSQSFATENVKVIMDTSKHFIQEKLKTELVLLRKMLIKEKSHLRKRVLTLENKFKKLQSEVEKQVTIMNDSIESKVDNLDRSMTMYKVIVDNRLTLAENDIQNSLNETDMIQEITSNIENKLTDSDAKMKQVETVFTGNISTMSQRLSTVNFNITSAIGGLNGRLDNAESQLRTMSSKLGKAEIHIPENGYLLGNERSVVLNGETYRICCKNGFEVVSDGFFPDDIETCKTIQNNYGTLEPKVQCLEERCDPTNLLNGYAEYENNSRIWSKFPSGLSIFLFCEDGFKFYDNSGQPIQTTPKRQCKKGEIINTPTCIEAKCSLAEQSNNQFKRYKDPDTMVEIATNGVVDSGQTIEVSCDKQYDLYLNNSKTYIDKPFIARCRRGKFNKNEFPVCRESVVYLISAKTGSKRYAGTDANVYIKLVGAEGITQKISFGGGFEKNDVDEIRITARDIRPIESVQIGHDGSGAGDGWYLDYVSIYVENMEEFYVFRNRDWVREENDLTLHKEGLDGCIDSFGRKLLWYPYWKMMSSFILGSKEGMNDRACKQACINLEHRNCAGVYHKLFGKIGYCWGFHQSEERYFKTEMNNSKGSVYLRKCKDAV